MKQKIIATTFLFILLSAACTMGDPVIGNWKMMNIAKESLEPIGMGGQEYIEFLSDGTYSQNFLTGGKWKRLDDSRLELQKDAFGPFKASTQIVTVKIEGNILTITESDGKSTKFKR